MKNYFRLLFVAMAMLIAHTTVAQEKRNYRDIAFDYLLQNISSIEARPWSVKADHYDKLSNGGYLVKLTIARTLTRQEDRLVNNQVQAYGATFNVGVRNATVNINYEDTKSYFVFVDRFGEASKYMEASTNHEIHTWGGNAWLLMNTHKERVGNKELSYFSNAACFSNKGETMWSGRDMKIYGWAFSGNTLYLVGTLWDNGRSIVRSIDIKTQEANDKVGNSGVIPSDIAFGEKGLTITQYASNGQSSDFVFPYAASDRQFQIEQVLKSYDLTRASDQIALGERYLSGNVVDKDEKKAVELFEKAANQNSDIGMLKLAECYMKGVGVAQDYAKAFSLYEKSANMGNVDAKKVLTKMYLNGIGTAANTEKAYDLIVDLAINSDLESQNLVIANKDTIQKYRSLADKVAESYVQKKMDCESTPHEWADFCCFFAAQKGIQKAQYHLCVRTLDGIGREKNINKAITMFGEYIERYNDSQAMVNLGMIYFKPEYGKVDYKEYAKWMSKAAKLGDPFALYNMGLAYEYGDGVKKNEKKAFKMFQTAADAGFEDARIEVILRLAKGTGVKRDFTQAEAMFRNLSVEKQEELADKIFWGKEGFREDKELGIKLFAIAATNGSKTAKEYLQRWSK